MKFGRLMTECVRGCGLCCKSISIKFSPDQFTEILEDHIYDKRKDRGSYWYDAEFVLDNWIYHGPDKINGHKYSCAQYDEVTRDCMAHENRPAVCSGYPWYGKENKIEKYSTHLSHNMCSFQADVRTMLPIVSIT